MSYDKSKLLTLGQGMHIADRILSLMQSYFADLTADDIAYGDSTVAEMIEEIEEKLKESGIDVNIATDEEVEEALDEVLGSYTPATVTTVNTLEGLNAALDDENIKRVILSGDIISTDNYTLELTNGQTKDIYLSGYMIKSDAPYVENELAIAVYVSGNSTLNIYGSNDGSIDGGNTDYSNCTVYVDGNSVVNIYGGSFTAGAEGDAHDSNVLYAVDGDINVYGGYYENPQFTDIQGNNCVMNIKNNSGSHITCYGGSFLDQNPADGDDKDTATGSTFVADGCVVTETEENGHILYTVSRE